MAHRLNRSSSSKLHNGISHNSAAVLADRLKSKRLIKAKYENYGENGSNPIELLKTKMID